MGHTLFHLTVFLQYSTTMDFLKKAVDAYQDSQSNTGNNNNQQQQQMHGQTNAGNNQAGGDFGVTGGSRFNQPASAQYGQGNNSGSGGGGLGGMLSQFLGNDVDEDEVVSNANQDSGSSGDKDLFGQAMGFLKNNQGAIQQGDVDEQQVVGAHEQAYSQGNSSNMSAQSMGAAAALQALKKFGSGQQSVQSKTGQSSLISMALSEASKLFDQSGGAANGNKQDVVNSAGQTIMKFIIKSQLSGAMGTGGSGGLMGMASKFL